MAGCLETGVRCTRPPWTAMRRLKKRFQFLNAARGKRVAGRFFVLQQTRVNNQEPGIGYTVTRKMGNSPERNRIKRRLRAMVAACECDFADRHDYVLIGRRDVLSAQFCELVLKLETALKKIRQLPPPERRSPQTSERPAPEHLIPQNKD